ncbi:DUF2075 domain-containing protein [Streptosporangium sp. NPDC020145]|uniref:DUF2075 domain-containing protein n=1 Tax=Streptosporangium sp. NPDC020145 TaxID=3154694 RepID=UPI00342E27EB
MFGEMPDPREVESWGNSIPAAVWLLLEAELDDVQVLLEMKTPITDVRIDMVLVGTHPSTGTMSVVVIENKQWSWARPVPDSEMVYAPVSPGRPTLHPLTQAWGYRQVLLDFIPLLRTAEVFCLVNMHNAPDGELRSVQLTVQPLGETKKMYPWTRMYGKDRRDEFKRLLKKVICSREAVRHAQELLEAPIRPTEDLMSLVAESIHHRPVFPLLDEQREAYDYVKARVTASRRGGHKEIVLIVGGPGTGKSVIAVELLGLLSRSGVHAVHATGSRSFTTTLREMVGGRTERPYRIFSYFNSFTQANENELEVLIADEAHRLRMGRRTSRHQNDAELIQGQLRELVRAARVPVFLLDEHQVVRQGEVGSVALIKETAAQMGLGVHQIDLRHQFRCGGCPEYVRWVEQLLGLDPEFLSPQSWQPIDTFELYVARSPAALENFLRTKEEQGGTARIAAGFCWEWSEPRRGTLADDIVIGDWRRPWNLKAREAVNGIPPSDLWATDSGGFGQIGCIYTAQGFEYDYAGVIFGPDLIWTGQAWRPDPAANKDSAARNSENFDRLVRNTYRVLATRGMRGAVLHSTDQATIDMLVSLGVPVLE